MNYYEEPCSKMLAFKPPRIAMALLTIATLAHFALPINWPTLPSLFITGVLFTTTGFGVMIRAWWLFRQHGTAICPTAETTSFISGDIYRLTRNPMYLGMIFILLGIALLAGSWAFYLVTGVYVLILNNVFCRYEERKLLDQYGDEYADYAARVRRWI
jgi:protein-S-isoprenylcysteine O-methyltransferase Ste14